MNRRVIGGVLAGAAALSVAAIDAGDNGIEFDPSKPAHVEAILQGTADYSDLTGRQTPARVILEQCLNGPESCSSATYPLYQLEQTFGQIEDGMIITVDPATTDK